MQDVAGVHGLESGAIEKEGETMLANFALTATYLAVLVANVHHFLTL